MSNEKGLLTRLRVKLTPQFLEEWLGAAGRRFRKTGERLSQYNQDHAKLGEKVDAAPDLLWKAAQGAANTQLAKAEADYAKAENDRIDAELKRRTMTAKARHEEADADKAQAEAGIAKVREVQARLELFKHLTDIGVSVTLDSSMNLVVAPAPPLPQLAPSDLLDAEEIEQVNRNLVEVRCPDLSFGGPATETTLSRWIASVGSRVEADQPIYEVSTTNVDSEVPAPASGTIIEIFVDELSTIVKGQLLANILAEEVVPKENSPYSPLANEFLKGWQDFETALLVAVRRMRPDAPTIHRGVQEFLIDVKSLDVFTDAERGALNMFRMKRNDAAHHGGAPDKVIRRDDIDQMKLFTDRVRAKARRAE